MTHRYDPQNDPSDYQSWIEPTPATELLTDEDRAQTWAEYDATHPGQTTELDREPELPAWAQRLADRGECAIVYESWQSSGLGWCVTHASVNSLGHFAETHPGANLD